MCRTTQTTCRHRASYDTHPFSRPGPSQHFCLTLLPATALQSSWPFLAHHYTPRTIFYVKTHGISRRSPARPRDTWPGDSRGGPGSGEAVRPDYVRDATKDTFAAFLVLSRGFFSNSVVHILCIARRLHTRGLGRRRRPGNGSRPPRSSCVYWGTEVLDALVACRPGRPSPAKDSQVEQGIC